MTAMRSCPHPPVPHAPPESGSGGSDRFGKAALDQGPDLWAAGAAIAAGLQGRADLFDRDQSLLGDGAGDAVYPHPETGADRGPLVRLIGTRAPGQKIGTRFRPQQAGDMAA